jgi:hypothetical protein
MNVLTFEGVRGVAVAVEPVEGPLIVVEATILLNFFGNEQCPGADVKKLFTSVIYGFSS